MSEIAWGKVKLLAMDVDGVLTDGTIEYRSDGTDAKRFHTADGLGIVLVRLSGIRVAWISGKASPAVERRAGELSVDALKQGIRDKNRALKTIQAEWGIAPEATAYMGDDWNDLPAFGAAGMKIAVGNAAELVKQRADYVTQRDGGNGAVREVIDLIIAGCIEHENLLERYLGSLLLREDSQIAAQ